MARANRRIEEIPELDVVHLYCDERLSAEEIGWRLGWSRSAIVSRLIHLGIARRTAWARNAVNCDINEVRRLYVVERLSLTAVGVRLGCSERTIRRLLEAAGVARWATGDEP